MRVTGASDGCECERRVRVRERVRDSARESEIDVWPDIAGGRWPVAGRLIKSDPNLV